MDLIKHFKDNLIEDKSEKVCKGKFFRASVNGFMSAGGTYTYQERMKPLKRMSCSGCVDCGWIEDDLNEFINNEVFPGVKTGIENGAIYTLTVTNISRDWESGVVDGYELQFVKYRQK
jgi:hypothetical protein